MIEGQIAEADLLAAYRLHSRKGWRFLIAFWGLGILAIVLGYLALLAGYQAGFLFRALGAGLVLGVSFSLVLALVLRYVSVPRSVRRIYHEDAELSRPFTYAWDDEALRGRTTTSRWDRPWSDYLRWRQDDRLVLLYRSSVIFEPVPKSWFRSEAELEEFQDTLRRHLGPPS